MADARGEYVYDSSRPPVRLQELTALVIAACQVLVSQYKVTDIDTWLEMQIEGDGEIQTSKKACMQVLMNGLQEMHPEVEVRSDVTVSSPGSEVKGCYFCVNPLHGEKAFIRHSGDFAVSVCFVDGGVCVAAAICVAPSLRVYYTLRGCGAYVEEEGRVAVLLRAPDLSMSAAGLRIVAEGDPSEVQQLQLAFLQPNLVSGAGPLKMLLVAEGKADLYARFSVSSECQTCAQLCVLEESGGCILWEKERKGRINPGFVACGRLVQEKQQVDRLGGVRRFALICLVLLGGILISCIGGVLLKHNTNM